MCSILLSCISFVAYITYISSFISHQQTDIQKPTKRLSPLSLPTKMLGTCSISIDHAPQKGSPTGSLGESGDSPDLTQTGLSDGEWHPGLRYGNPWKTHSSLRKLIYLCGGNSTSALEGNHNCITCLDDDKLYMYKPNMKFPVSRSNTLPGFGHRVVLFFTP